MSSINSSRSDVGSGINVLSDTSTGLAQSITNLTGSDSTISDADMAQAVMRQTTDSIKSQFSMQLLAQTNSLNQRASLSLLKAM
jgi:flagellin-like hook-associated protein FlgL